MSSYLLVGHFSVGLLGGRQSMSVAVQVLYMYRRRNMKFPIAAAATHDRAKQRHSEMVACLSVQPGVPRCARNSISTSQLTRPLRMRQPLFYARCDSLSLFLSLCRYRRRQRRTNEFIACAASPASAADAASSQ